MDESSYRELPQRSTQTYTDDPTQWIFHGHPCGSVVWDENKKWTTHGPLRTDNTVLHVAVARLLGYRWPAELDADMELADEQREWVHRCKALARHADDDGIVCISPVRGEPSASDRLLNLLAAAYGDAWSSNILAALLKSANHARQNTGDLAAGEVFRPALQAIQPPPLHLAHLGWSARRLRRPGQLP